MIRNWLAIAAAVVLVGAFACGSDDGGNDGGSDGRNTNRAACEVFSTAELSDAMGTEMKPGESEDRTVCEWVAVDEVTGRSVSLQIYPGGASGYDESLELLKSNEDATFTDLEGVGDKAYLMVFEFDLGFPVLVVQAGAAEGDDMVVVTTGAKSGPGVESALSDTTRGLLVTALERI